MDGDRNGFASGFVGRENRAYRLSTPRFDEILGGADCNHMQSQRAELRGSSAAAGPLNEAAPATGQVPHRSAAVTWRGFRFGFKEYNLELID